MDQTYRNPVVTLYSKTLNLKPGQADDIDIESPTNKEILEVFFFDQTGANKKTALTGKQFISSVKWNLTFFNLDTTQPVTLNFFVSTSPY